MTDYLLTLCREYLTLCETMTSHHYHSEDERAALSRQRTWTHDELIRLTGHARPFDMKAYARQVVNEATR